MENLQEFLLSPFAGGLALGLLLTFFTWKSAFSAKRALKKDMARISAENKELQQHLNTQLKVSAEGNESLQQKLEDMREKNENLRVNMSTLQQKPGRAELRQLTIIENGIGIMREQAPGFAQAWEKAVRQAEVDYEASESGIKKLVRKVLPGIGTAGPVIHEEETSTKGSFKDA